MSEYWIWGETFVHLQQFELILSSKYLSGS